MIAAGLLTANDITAFHEGTSGAWRDQRWTDAAVHIIERHRPNLMLFHLLALDGINHHYGPGTPASQTAMAFLDAQVARAPGRDRSCGHSRPDDGDGRVGSRLPRRGGFDSSQREVARARLDLGQRWQTSGPRPGHARGAALPASTSAIAPGGRTCLVASWGRCSALPGVERAIGSQDLASVNFPDPSTLDQAPDLVLTAAKGYDFEDEDTGPVIRPLAPIISGIMACWPAILTWRQFSSLSARASRQASRSTRCAISISRRRSPSGWACPAWRRRTIAGGNIGER